MQTKVTNPQKVLGQAIRARRRALRLTQEQLAERSDLHWTYISGIERGVRNVTIGNLFHIARALNVRVRDLVKDL